jgi:uncharacterized hydrophobic protein (TIGR00271 family)
LFKVARIGVDTVLLVHNEAALAALSWACHLSQRMRGQLHVLVLSADSMTGVQRASPDSDDNPELVDRTFAALAAAGIQLDTVYDCRAYRLRRAALNAIAELQAGLLILHGTLSGERRKERGLIRDLARVAPVDVLILDVESAGERPERVLFAQVRGSGAHGMKFALRALCDEEHPLLVLPDPEAQARSRRAFERVQGEVGKQRAKALQLLDVPESLDALIREEVSGGDLVLVDSEEAARVGGRLRHLQKLRDGQPDARFSIGVTRANHLAGPGWFERLLERFHRHFPKLDRDTRRRIATDLERGGRMSVDFLMMLVLSAGIAALGLVQNSTAVVIGGMLVAPLMTPLLAIGLALVQGNLQQFRESSRAMAAGVGGALVAAMAIGLLSPWEDLSAEVVARGAPNLFDLAIAGLSGIAAAYSLARPGLAGTLVGVAVAVALVPPLCAASIALVKSHFDIALGAAVLFVTNLLAIILGAALVFRLFGLDISLQGRQAPRWVRVTLVALGIALLPVGGVLFANLETQIHEGVQRNYSRPLPPSLRAAIRERVRAADGVEVLIMEQSGIEKGFDMHVALAVRGDLDPSLEEDLRRLIAREVGDRHRVSILLLRSVDGD